VKRSYIILLILGVASIGFFASVKYYSSQKKLPEVTSTTSEVTMANVALHNTADNCWIIIGQKVYSMTSFNTSHPDDATFAKLCGTNATSALKADIASAESDALLKKIQSYYIGIIVP
jgi:cytochrome b involved in lipid metabolism